MKVSNMTSNKGNKIANQFIIYDDNNNKYFQSYKSVIAKKQRIEKKELRHYEDQNYSTLETITETKVYLDEIYWNYSVTTSKYRNIFLNETTKETQKKIKQGVYILTNLN